MGDFDLDDVTGVRIYHVSSEMEKRILIGEDEVEYPIGTIHYANTYTKDGKYLLELIQAGGDNTFTDLDNLRINLDEMDFFKEGDIFTMEDYSEFFVNEKFDNGKEFGYSIEIIDIVEKGENSTATIRITRD